MRVLNAVLVLGVQAATLAAAACTSDNCYRAVAGTAFPTRHASADCASFLKATVTPATITVLATATITPTVTATDTTVIMKRKADHPASPLAPVIEVRQVTVRPTSTPAYASVCSGTVRYSSACSCIGVTATTVTVATPTTTVTVATATAPTVTITKCSGPQPTFVIQASLPGDPTDGMYAISQSPGQESDFLDFATTDITQANVFILNAAGNLETNGELANLDEDAAQYGILFFNSPGYIAVNSLFTAVCSISQGVLSCNANGDNKLFACDSTISLGSTEPTFFDCVNPVFKAVPLCTPN